MKNAFKFLTYLAIVGILGSCTLAPASPTQTPVIQTVLVPETSIPTANTSTPGPAATLAAVAPTVTKSPGLVNSKIQHIIIIMQENRCFSKCRQKETADISVPYPLLKLGDGVSL